MILPIFAAVFAAVVSVVVLWANPQRLTNRVFSFFLCLVIAYLICTIRITSTGNLEVYTYWINAAKIIASFFPWSLWILRESLLVDESAKLKPFARSSGWFSFGILLAIPCLYNNIDIYVINKIYFYKKLQHAIRPSLLIFAYVFLAFETYRMLKRQTGIRKLEMQFLVLNFSIVGLSAVAFTAIGRLPGQIPAIIREFNPSAISVLSACIFTAWAFTYHRIFELEQVILSICQRLGFIIFICLGIFTFQRLLEILISHESSLVLSVLIATTFGLWLEKKSRFWFDVDGERVLNSCRASIIEMARREADPQKLVVEFTSLLSRVWKTDSALLLIDDGNAFIGGNIKFEKETAAFHLLCEKGWTTPESLERTRKSDSSIELHRFATLYRLGLLAASPRGSATPSLVVALGTRRHAWPYTYPEIERLQKAIELMDNILTRARLTTQAALTARMEHLAMMSRGLAHDLKNLITPVSSFLIHTDNHFAAGTPEAEVHSAARRSVRIMTDYVREALFFSERLAPNYAPVDMGKLCKTVKEITAARSTRNEVSVSFLQDYSGPLVSDAVLLQRMLGNLVNNAIDASSPGQQVTVSVFAGAPGKVRFQVKDEGSGIAPENLSRVFEPYFTTKDFGEDIRGFGLGLTICQKIAHLHGGTISVQSELRRGTTVTVDLPSSPVSIRDKPLLSDEETRSRPR